MGTAMLVLALTSCGSPTSVNPRTATGPRAGPSCAEDDFIVTISDTLGEDQNGGPSNPLDALRAFTETDDQLRGLNTDDWEVVDRTSAEDNRPEQANLAVAREGRRVGAAVAARHGDSWAITGFSACTGYIKENGGGSE